MFADRERLTVTTVTSCDHQKNRWSRPKRKAFQDVTTSVTTVTTESVFQTFLSSFFKSNYPHTYRKGSHGSHISNKYMIYIGKLVTTYLVTTYFEVVTVVTAQENMTLSDRVLLWGLRCVGFVLAGWAAFIVLAIAYAHIAGPAYGMSS